jgi:NitT/TauT family transport system substrate-binding protein
LNLELIVDICSWIKLNTDKDLEIMLEKVLLRSMVIFSITVFSFCGGENHASLPQKIKIGWSLWPGWYPVPLAVENKIFESCGLNIEANYYDSYQAIFEDFAAGKLDGGFAGFYEIIKSNIPDVAIVLITDYSNGAEGLIASPEIVSGNQLKGMRIGLQGPISVGEMLTLDFLKRSGMTSKDVVFVDVAPEKMPQALPDKIKAGYTWDPYFSEAVKAGNRILFSTADYPYSTPDVLFFHQTIINNNPLTIKGFLDAWFKACDYWIENPEKANDIIANATNQNISDINLKGVKLLSREANIKAFQDDDQPGSIYQTGKKDIEFIKNMGDLTEEPDLKIELHPEFLK